MHAVRKFCGVPAQAVAHSLNEKDREESLPRSPRNTLVTNIRDSVLSDEFEHDLLCAFPQDLFAELAQVFLAFDDSQEVVAGQLAHFAGKTA
jgi:hypothetical protein